MPTPGLVETTEKPFTDLVADFDRRALMNNGDLATSSRSLVLRGRLRNGIYVRGVDAVAAR